ncbi:MAG: hypothetical protein R3E90_04080 [Marinicella sp.]
MKKAKTLTLIIGFLFQAQIFAAIYYVGEGAQCNGANHQDSLALALFAAALNGDSTDEIRLTNTVSYLGNGDGTTTLSGWNSGGAGQLTIAGGYANCGDPVNASNAVIGGGSDAVFEIVDNSVVTLRNLQLFGSNTRGLTVDENSTVFLQQVDVSSNWAGIQVMGGSYLSVDGSSIVQNNGDLDNVTKGGGIWCMGTNTEVNIEGFVSRNQAVSGGNLYIEDGCYLHLEGGSTVQGSAALFHYNATNGGGILVHDGGTLMADGGANRVQIIDHWALNDGGAVYVHGTGRATLLNTYIANNSSQGKGTGLFAINGGTSVDQVIMDRVAACPFLISCSEFEGNIYSHSVVYVQNSRVKISRTIFEAQRYITFDNVIRGIIHTTNSGKALLSHINMINNDAFYLMINYGDIELAHMTAVGNNYDDNDIGTGDSFAWGNLGDLRLQNSIWQNTQGGDNRGGVVTAKCNLVDNSTDWPASSYVVGTATFNNVAGGDSRQQSNSVGVDMCLADTFAWNTDRDIEYQVTPVNENTNPQGDPGENGGLYDAGFDEVYDNIGEDEFLLTVQRTGSGTGFVVSSPLGIACGTDCTEVFFNGTLVTLTAQQTGASVFSRWIGCPLANGNQCSTAVTSSHTITAEFLPNDLIFANGFE